MHVKFQRRGRYWSIEENMFTPIAEAEGVNTTSTTSSQHVYSE